MLALGAVIAVAVIGAFVAIGTSAADARYSCDAITPAPSGSVPPEGIEMPDMGNAHVSPGAGIDYAACPPTSGSHYNAAGAGPLRAGFSGPGDLARPGGWVHNLEHGYIVALYRGEPDQATLQALRRFYEQAPATDTAAACGYRAKVIVARFDDMATPFSVLAWDHLLPMTTWDEAAALSFAQRWVEQSGPEPNAC